jgi:hypothetical protein
VAREARAAAGARAAAERRERDLAVRSRGWDGAMMAVGFFGTLASLLP